MNDEQSDLNHEAYIFTLDERVPNQERLIKLARNRDDQSQNAVEGASATIENIAKGRWFDLGAFNIANARVTGSASGLLEEGVDYDLDQPNGRIHILSTGDATSGETLSIIFDQPGLTLEKRETQQDPLFYCDIVIEEFNQYHKMWLRRLVFRGYLNLTEFPQQTGECSFYKVKATPAGPVTELKRPEAATLPTHSEIDAAGMSSSSSRSSHSSSSSSSSKSSASSKSSQSSSSSTVNDVSSEELSGGDDPMSQSSSLSSQSSSSSSTAQSVTSSSSSSTEHSSLGLTTSFSESEYTQASNEDDPYGASSLG